MANSLEDALVNAAGAGETGRVEKLLRRGVSANAIGESGMTALYAAALLGDPTAVRLLLVAGADPNLESSGESNGTALCAAVAWGYWDVTEELLAYGAGPNQREDEGTGFAPLLWACRSGHLRVAQLLVEAGADVNVVVFGATPLHTAAERGNLAVFRLLLEHGADSCAIDDQGQTPLDIAEAWLGRDVEVELRRQAGAREGEEVRCSRTAGPNGTELVNVEVSSRDGGGRVVERETGHGMIAELLGR